MKTALALVFVAATLPMIAQLNPSTMAKVGEVSPRFQSYNVEMVEVVGGRFWKPYGSTAVAPPSATGTPGGVDPSLFEQRTPVDLSNVRLRKMAKALGPTYLRVSGSWANTLYFQDSDAPAPATPPAGFNAVLTRAQWKGVIDFAKAVDGEIVTSFATGGGTRDAAGVWTPKEAKKFMDYTRSAGGDDCCGRVHE
jgi:heparanase 1